MGTGTFASRISRSTKRSNIISNKFKTLIIGNSKSPTKMLSMSDGVFNNSTAEMRKNIGRDIFHSFYHYQDEDVNDQSRHSGNIYLRTGPVLSNTGR